ncbi:zinc finger protein 852-like [Corythoichthys intestinalis]|uniref:zinc finger protein 852-like n=1 Tax=Corythoichthys intestinalis TaxID=161448 RepID=UPI0025A4CEB5|nr:zinc finger protein 852-like [Corythoichthys intestinalis]XP_057687597.1 zinc finger protein 852-like [Corythoichthys intestinalis]
MLKELVRKRLIAAADEICELFAETIASYEEQLRRLREETELHRRHPKAISKTQTVLRVQDVQHQGESSRTEQESHHEEGDYPQSPLDLKEEEEEAVVSDFPQTDVFDVSEDDIDNSPDWSRLRGPIGDSTGGLASGDVFAPSSDNDDAEDPFRSDNEHLTSYENRATFSSKDASPKPKKSYICSICGRVMASNSVLIIHMRKHTGEKPFVCSVCGKAFIQKSHLGSHMITHTGEKPFSCSFCGLTFSYKCNLNKHMLKHK